jgi:hypothetical protein
MGKGRQFVKGEKRPERAGRRAGTPNKMTVEMKALMEGAIDRLGGLEGLMKWIHADPKHKTIFWSVMCMRLLPVQVMGSGKDGSLVIEIKQEELMAELEARGLPPIVFDKNVPPLLELKATNGKGRQ